VVQQVTARRMVVNKAMGGVGSVDQWPRRAVDNGGGDGQEAWDQCLERWSLAGSVQSTGCMWSTPRRMAANEASMRGVGSVD